MSEEDEKDIEQRKRRKNESSKSLFSRATFAYFYTNSNTTDLAKSVSKL